MYWLLWTPSLTYNTIYTSSQSICLGIYHKIMYECFKSNPLAISPQISNISTDLRHIQAKSLTYSLTYNPWFLSLLIILPYSPYSSYSSLIPNLFQLYLLISVLFQSYSERGWKPFLCDLHSEGFTVIGIPKSLFFPQINGSTSNTCLTLCILMNP